jgi:hypothetical protein
MGRANGSRECAPDDKLRDTHQVVAAIIPTAGDGFRKCSTHPTGSNIKIGERVFFNFNGVSSHTFVAADAIQLLTIRGNRTG